MIPKIIHIIWVGDESQRPNNCIKTWIDNNRDYEIRVWGNKDLAENNWINSRHIQAMWSRELCGVADLMRWEILLKYGGILVDADSICVKGFTDDFLDDEAFACWENEKARPGLIAAGYVGSVPGNKFINKIVADIHGESSVVNDKAWRTVGPLRLTESYWRYRYHPLKIYPSHYFIPEHYSGLKYSGPGTVFARQFWGSTVNGYDKLKEINIEQFLIDNNF